MIPKLFFELLDSAAAAEARQQRPAPTILTVALNEHLFILFPFKANVFVHARGLPRRCVTLC